MFVIRIRETQSKPHESWATALHLDLLNKKSQVKKVFLLVIRYGLLKKLLSWKNNINFLIKIPSTSEEFKGASYFTGAECYTCRWNCFWKKLYTVTGLRNKLRNIINVQLYGKYVFPQIPNYWNGKCNDRFDTWLAARARHHRAHVSYICRQPNCWLHATNKY